MKEIIITNNIKVLVDDEDFEWLNQYNWWISSKKRMAYAKGYVNGSRILMHRLIAQKYFEGMEEIFIDHIDGNTFNNQKNNLRIATHKQNMMNKKGTTGSRSKYKGVCWHKSSGKWAAYIKKDQKQKHLGLFNAEIEAAEVYNKAAKELFGKYALLNRLEEEVDKKLIKLN